MAVSELEIDELGPQGDGICRGRNRVYVERALPGDRLKARVFKDKAGLPRAEILEILRPSSYRQTAPCVHYDRCGNCTLQHLQLEAYRSWKTEMVRQTFRSQRLSPKRWLETVFIGDAGRRRATFSASKARGKVTLGYYRRRSQEIIDINSCLVSHPRLLELRTRALPLAGLLLKEGEVADFFFQLVGESVDMVITAEREPSAAAKKPLAEFAEKNNVQRVGWRSSEKAGVKFIVSRAPIIAKFGELEVYLPPAAFLQATADGESALVRAVMSALPRQGKFADLFSGCGTFSGPMLQRGSVDSYESTPSAVKALQQSAGKKPLRVFRRDLFKQPLRRDELSRYDAVVFDPPRAGAEEQAWQLAKSKVGVVIGVSCNPATLSRDARILCDGGYWLQSIQVVDQFQWSHHVEVVAVFTKR